MEKFLNEVQEFVQRCLNIILKVFKSGDISTFLCYI